MRTFCVLLFNRSGHPWSDRKALRLVAADTVEQAVREAHDFPPSYDVDSAWVVEVVGQPTIVPVRVPRPEWDAPKGIGDTDYHKAAGVKRLAGEGT